MSISPNLTKATDNTKAAKVEIDRLNDLLQDNDASYAKDFKDRVDASLKEMALPDAMLGAIQHKIRVSYASEFNIDGLADIVIAALETAEKVSSSPADNPAMSKEAVEGYISVVNAVAAAARSKSSTEANLSYSMTQIGPGTFAFLYAVSQTIHDEAMFGSESITGTAIYYRLVNSLEAVKKSADFNLALRYYQLIDELALIQLNNTKDLNMRPRGIDLASAMSYNTYSRDELKKVRSLLRKLGYDPSKPPMLMMASPDAMSFAPASLKDQLAAAEVEARNAIADMIASGGEEADFARAQLQQLDEGAE